MTGDFFHVWHTKQNGFQFLVWMTKTETQFSTIDCVIGMKSLPEKSVDVTVTSPPYNLGIKYAKYDDKKPHLDYMEWTKKWIGGVHRVLKDDGSFFLNLGATPSQPLLPYQVLIMACENGWFLQNTLHWIKSISIDTAEGDTVSAGHFKPINSQRFLNDCHEFVFHLTKTGNVRIDRLALGVPYKDKSNLKRWTQAAGNDNRCRGNNWSLPSIPNGDQNARWLALLVDTEGTICVNINSSRIDKRSPSHVAVVSITNCNRTLLNIARMTIGDGRIDDCPPPSEDAPVQGTRPVYRLTLTSRSAYELLLRIYPWLIVKQNQAKAAIYLESLKQNREIQRERLDSEEIRYREQICDTMKALNAGEMIDDSWIPAPTVVASDRNTMFVPYQTIKSRNKQRPHPATFPPKLAENCIRLHGNIGPETVVLDPFLGIGNAAIGAINAGVGRFLGFDIDHDYISEARRRTA